MEAKRVESTWTGGDRSINSSCHVIVNKFFVSKNQKEKKRKPEMKGGEDENIKQKINKLRFENGYENKSKSGQKSHSS